MHSNKTLGVRIIGFSAALVQGTSGAKISPRSGRFTKPFVKCCRRGMSAQSYAILNTYPWYINPRACRRVWLKGVVLVSVLGLCLFLCSLAARSCFVWIKVTPLLPLLLPLLLLLLHLLRRLLRLRLLYSSTPSSLLPHVTTLVVPVAHDIAYSITVVYSYSSQDAHGTDRLVLIWYAFHLVVPARACYSSCFWSTALSSSLLLSGFHVACTSTSLGAISLPCLSFHAADCWVCCQDRGSHIVPGATLLGRC